MCRQAAQFWCGIYFAQEIALPAVLAAFAWSMTKSEMREEVMHFIDASQSLGILYERCSYWYID
jgi:hypothetical protein